MILQLLGVHSTVWVQPLKKPCHLLSPVRSWVPQAYTAAGNEDCGLAHTASACQTRTLVLGHAGPWKSAEESWRRFSSSHEASGMRRVCWWSLISEHIAICDLQSSVASAVYLFEHQGDMQERYCYCLGEMWTMHRWQSLQIPRWEAFISYQCSWGGNWWLFIWQLPMLMVWSNITLRFPAEGAGTISASPTLIMKHNTWHSTSTCTSIKLVTFWK